MLTQVQSKLVVDGIEVTIEHLATAINKLKSIQDIITAEQSILTWNDVTEHIDILETTAIGEHLVDLVKEGIKGELNSEDIKQFELAL